MRVLATLSITTGLLLSACGDEYQSGLDEPFRVERAFFHEGVMPDIEIGEGSATELPQITTVDLVSGVFYPWQLRRRVSGRTSGNAASVGVALEGQNSGFWVLPTGAVDVLTAGERTFELYAAIGSPDVGLHNLQLVAFDEDGNAGPQRRFEICIASELPDNLNSCEPTLKPPAAIVALTWNTQADVDLVLYGPGGEVLDARRPFGTTAEGAIPADVLRDTTIPRFDRDSNAGCRVDGRRREHVIFPDEASAGTWLVNARLFDACGQPSVTATVEVFRRVDNGDGTWALLNVGAATTSFIAEQADPSDESSTYLLPITF